MRRALKLAMKRKTLPLEATALLAVACAGSLLKSKPDDELIADAAAPDAPVEIEQFGRLVGQWKCLGSEPDEDGNWVEESAESTWTWHYVLGGYAVQDLWEPGPGIRSGSLGTNLRIYNADDDIWHLTWTSAAQQEFDYFSGSERDGRIVLLGERPARRHPAHAARVTFDNIEAERFDWQYETAPPGASTGWTPAARLECRRVR